MATLEAITHWHPYNIPCKSPAWKAPVSAFGGVMTVKVVETVEGDVGEPDSTVTKDFIIYRGLLWFRTAFFKSILGGPFKEDGPAIYTITNCTIRTFTLFYNWMNTGVFALGMYEADNLIEIDAVLLYQFADFYGVPALKNGALEFYLMTALEDVTVHFEAVHAVYERTPENGPLRKLVLDVLMHTKRFNMSVVKQASAQSPQLGTDLLDRYWSADVAPGSNKWNGFPGYDEWYDDMMQHFCERYHHHTHDCLDSMEEA